MNLQSTSGRGTRLQMALFPRPVMTERPLTWIVIRVLPHSPYAKLFSQLIRVSITAGPTTGRARRCFLSVGRGHCDTAEKVSCITPAKAVLVRPRYVSSCSATICSRFTRNQDSVDNELDYIELGLPCADVCFSIPLVYTNTNPGPEVVQYAVYLRLGRYKPQGYGPICPANVINTQTLNPWIIHTCSTDLVHKFSGLYDRVLSALCE